MHVVWFSENFEKFLKILKNSMSVIEKCSRKMDKNLLVGSLTRFKIGFNKNWLLEIRSINVSYFHSSFHRSPAVNGLIFFLEKYSAAPLAYKLVENTSLVGLRKLLRCGETVTYTTSQKAVLLTKNGSKRSDTNVNNGSEAPINPRGAIQLSLLHLAVRL